MELFVDVAQVLVGDVGVNLSRVDIRMAEHGLHRADVGAVAEEVGREHVTHHVRRNFLGNSGFDGERLHHSLYGPFGYA